MASREKHKKEIEKIINIFNSSPSLLTANEADTERKLIEPLIEALGWKFEEENISKKEHLSNEFPDYTFKIKGHRKFILEAKGVKESLDGSYEKKTFVQQAIKYAKNADCTWAVLTNFKEFRLYSTDKTDNKGLVFNIPYTEFLTSGLDRMLFLSKESITNSEIDKYGEDFGFKKKRIKIDEILLEDLLEYRELLSKDIHKNNIELRKDIDLCDDVVQKLLDRLIFIRNCEDIEIEHDKLISYVGLKNIMKRLREAFSDNKRYGYYNSALFSKHPLDSSNIIISDEAIFEVIKGLYESKKTGVKYNFSEIESDILGSIYEQYLSHLLNKRKKGGLGENLGKKKKQGIYYTPVYVVDYIIRNTLLKVLEGKSKSQLLNIKVLDMACGSGSFLIKCFDILEQAYLGNFTYNKLKKNKKDTYYLDLETENLKSLPPKNKCEIIESNIYGVDLDKQAVEIAQLNLLLKIKYKFKLPFTNIKQGNALIENPLADDHAFNWLDNFGIEKFDVIIGNPPYLKEKDNKDVFNHIRKSEYAKYYQGKMDLWYFFLHRAMDLIKEGGYIGFITNSYWTKNDGASSLISRLKKDLTFVKVVDFDDIKVFKDVSGKHMIHIYQKIKGSSKNCDVIKLDKEIFHDNINDFHSVKISNKEIFSQEGKISLEKRLDITKNTLPLGKLYDSSIGIQESTDKITDKHLMNKKPTNFNVGDGVFVLNKEELDKLILTDKEKNIIKKYLNTNNVIKYGIKFDNEFLFYIDKETKGSINNRDYPNIKRHLDKMQDFVTSSNKPYGLHRYRGKKWFVNPKLICKGMFGVPEFSYDDNKYFVGFSFSVIIQKNKQYDLKYLLALLNSNVGEYWFHKEGKKRGIGVDIGVKVFRKFPVPELSPDKQKEIISLVDKITDLTKALISTSDKHAEKIINIKQQIKNIGKTINYAVYKLYNVDKEEQKIIESSIISGVDEI